jgi:hypothetical protein
VGISGAGVAEQPPGRRRRPVLPAISHPTAKRMNRFLDKRFNKRFNHRDEMVIDLKEFAFDHVGLSRGE